MRPKPTIQATREILKSYVRSLDAKKDAELRLEAITLLRNAESTLDDLELMVQQLKEHLYPTD